MAHQLEVSVDQASVDHLQVEASEVIQVVHKLPLFKNTSTSMSHHQSKKKLDNNVQFQLHQLKNITKLSSSRLHHLQHTKHLLFQFNHKMKKRLWFTFWSKNQKINKILLSQHQPQLSQANQKFISSNTRLKKMEDHQLEVTTVEHLEISDHQVLEQILDQLHKTHNLNMDHLENSNLAQSECMSSLLVVNNIF